MNRASSLFLLVLPLFGCASAPPPPLTELPPPVGVDKADYIAPPAAPAVAGDIQFTVTDRGAKTAPAGDDQQAGTLQVTKANTSGMTSTGTIKSQHIHSAQ